MPVLLAFVFLKRYNILNFKSYSITFFEMTIFSKHLNILDSFYFQNMNDVSTKKNANKFKNHRGFHTKSQYLCFVIEHVSVGVFVFV